MVEKWVGKFAVVTGASAGIGAAIFKDFARSGINVIGLARRLERIEALIEELGPTPGKAFARKCDVSDPEAVKETFKHIQEKFGVVHILVNNAGIVKNMNLLDEGDGAFEMLNEIMDTNVRGLVQCTREAFRLMKMSGDYGLIINITSIHSHHVPFLSVSQNLYTASKHTVTALTETIRQELVMAGNKKIRITCLGPGFVDTEIDAVGGFDTTLLAAMPKLISEDISSSVMFLLSTPYPVNITEMYIRPVGERF